MLQQIITFGKLLLKFADYISYALERAAENLDFETQYVGHRKAMHIMDNFADKRLIEETVQKLKEKYTPEGIEITLSCGNKITISI